MVLLNFFSVLIHSRTLAREWCHAQWVSFPNSSRAIKIIPHIQIQRSNSQVLDSVKSTINTNHHKYHQYFVFSITLPTFQMLSNFVWLVLTILDSTNTKHSQHFKMFYWAVLSGLHLHHWIQVHLNLLSQCC